MNIESLRLTAEEIENLRLHWASGSEARGRWLPTVADAQFNKLAWGIVEWLKSFDPDNLSDLLEDHLWEANIPEPEKVE